MKVEFEKVGVVNVYLDKPAEVVNIICGGRLNKIVSYEEDKEIYGRLEGL